MRYRCGLRVDLERLILELSQPRAYPGVDPNTAIDKNHQAMLLVGINGLFFQSEKTGARWQIEYTSRESFNAGSITTAGNTKYRDNRLWAQLTFGF